MGILASCSLQKVDGMELLTRRSTLGNLVDKSAAIRGLLLPKAPLAEISHLLTINLGYLFSHAEPPSPVIDADDDRLQMDFSDLPDNEL